MPKLRTRTRTEGGEGSWAVEVDELWYEETVDGWVYAMRLDGRPGDVVVTELRVFPEEPAVGRDPGEWDTDAQVAPGGLSTKTLRKARVPTWLKEAKEGELSQLLSRIPPEELEAAFRLGDLGVIDSPLASVQILSRRQLGRSHPGRRGHPDRYYLAYAVAYVTQVEAGHYDAIKRAAVERRISPAESKNLRAKCVEKGFLEASGMPGRAGGGLTKKSLDLLARLEDAEDDQE
jgi:hypothetical protein